MLHTYTLSNGKEQARDCYEHLHDIKSQWLYFSPPLLLHQRWRAPVRRQLATTGSGVYPVVMLRHSQTLSYNELRARLSPFCEKHHIRRLEVFGSAACGQTSPGSDVDLLVTLDESMPVSTAELLEMAGEAEELVGRRVDFVLRPSLEKSPNRFAREHILATAVCFYGN
jgi:uncharacterized protein